MVQFYTTHCPLCEKLEDRLKEYDIPYQKVDDPDAVAAFCYAHDIDTVPVLYNGTVMDYATAMRWAKAGGPHADKY